MTKLYSIILVLFFVLACGSQDGSGSGTGDGQGGSGDGSGASGDGSGDSGESSGGRPRGEIDGECDRILVDADETHPNVLIILDRSGSMYMPPSVDRWTPSVAAVNTMSSNYENRFRLGLMLFGTGTSGCGPGELVLSPALNQASAIEAALSGHPEDLTGGGTPTANILGQAREVLGGLDGRSYVVLVTDGAPNCNSSSSGRQCVCTNESGSTCTRWSQCLDDDRTIAQIEALAADGVPTYVIGYETEAWATVLDEMAAAGGTGLTQYFPVDDRASLEAALDGIARGVLSCSYRLGRPPGDYRYVSVEVDGEPLQHESVHPNGGWTLVGDDTIEIVGASCEALQDGANHTIDIAVECERLL